MGSVNITHRSVGGKPHGVSTFMCTGGDKGKFGEAVNFES